MPARLSIVIPTLNAADTLPATADSLLEGAGSGLVRDLVISDGGSTDATIPIATELGATIVTGAKGRGGQIARGVAAARGEWLLILHADTQLQPDWSVVCGRFMAHHPDRAGYFRLRFNSDAAAARIVEAGAALRVRVLDLPYGDQGLLIHRDLLANVGGVPDVPLMEDVALARALKGLLLPLGRDALTSPARYEADGWARRAFCNLWTLSRYLTGTPPERLVSRYEGRRQSSEN